MTMNDISKMQFGIDPGNNKKINEYWLFCLRENILIKAIVALFGEPKNKRSRR